MGFSEWGTVARARLAETLLAERERWILWLPVFVGAGDAVYFALPVEPGRTIGPALLVAAIVAAIALRHRLVWMVAAVGVGAMAFGFTLAVERTR
jgi:competence protein ComEC